MKFSVLMSVYVKESPLYLAEALESVLNQTVKADEIVIVEDGSLTEDLYEVLGTFANENPTIKRYPLQENQGLGIALRYGVEKCQYDWIARMDTDDIAINTRFEEQIQYIEQHAEVDVIGSNIDEYDETMHFSTGRRSVPELHADITKGMRRRSPFNHMTVMYKKDTVLKAGNYQDCLYFEDYYLWCRIAAINGVFHNIQRSLVKARGGSNMHKRRGGLMYAKAVINFQNKIYRLNIIHRADLLTNICIRLITGVAPIRVRSFIYNKLLRTSSSIDEKSAQPLVPPQDYSSELVSVIITTYQRPSFLERAIKSALYQTHKNIEVIVVDDNSDGDQYRKETEKVMSKLSHSGRVIYIKHPKNMNGSAARNTGIHSAKGVFITFLDDDDFFFPTRIEELLRGLARNPRAKCAYSGVAFMYNGKLINTRRPVQYTDHVYELLTQNSFFGTGSNFLCRTDAVHRIQGFDESFTRHQDIEFMIRLLESSMIAEVDNILVVKSMDSILNVPNPEKLLQVKLLFLEKFNYIIKAYIEEKALSVMYKNYLEVARAFALNGVKYNQETQDALNSIGGLGLKDRLSLSFIRIFARLNIVYQVKYFIRRVLNRDKNSRALESDILANIAALEVSSAISQESGRI